MARAVEPEAAKSIQEESKSVGWQTPLEPSQQKLQFPPQQKYFSAGQ
jgi:hypothetical protein